MSVDTSVHICEHTLHRVCTCARICAICSLALGDEGGGVQLVYAGHLLLAWGVIFDMMKDNGVVCIFSIFDGGLSVCRCMWVYTHTHTHTARGVLRCEPRGRDETVGEPK